MMIRSITEKAKEKVDRSQAGPQYRCARWLIIISRSRRRAVVTAYEHRCAVCGVRMLTADGHTVVDAAHIKPWSVSFNDNPRNGMALCKLCHWTFDEGMISVSARYIVVTSPQLSINHNIPGHVITFASRKIIGPEEEKLWPDLEALSWHRQNVFRNR